MQCRAFSSSLAFYPLMPRASTPTVTTIKNVSRHCLMSPERKNCPHKKNHWSSWKVQCTERKGDNTELESVVKRRRETVSP